MKILNVVLPTDDFLYLLQLEEYDSSRYAKLLPRFFFRRNLQVRDTLKNTKRIQQMRLTTVIIMVLSVALFLLFVIQYSFFIILFYLFTVSFLMLLLTPIIVLLTNLLMTPWYESLKSQKEKQAAQIISNLPELKIVAITGSYGKTTTKNVLFELLKSNYRVQFTPGNINTPTGIAQWIIDKLQPNTQIAIIEMDAYNRGEIARSCAITPPDIALITNFGDQHLERFGSHENLTLAYLEAFTQSKPSATLLLNRADYQKAKQYQSTQQVLDQPNLHLFDISTASSAAKINIQNAKAIAECLHISPELIDRALTDIQLPDRRGDLKQIDGYTVIDRSYNISANTAKQGVLEASELAKSQAKDLVIITAGIPERGGDSDQVNKEYGQFVKQYTNYIIILQSIYAPSITAGINDPSKIKPASRMSEAIKISQSIGQPDQILILQQPELTDLSY